jgi:hypothetical protein
VKYGNFPLTRRGETATAALRAIDPKARFEVSFVDAGRTETMRGDELARLAVAVPQVPGSALVFYKKVR